MEKIDYQKLWDDGGYGKDNKLEASIKYVRDTGKKLNIPDEVIEMAILEVFLRIATGHKYSTTECSCGCGIDNSGTDAIHAMVSRMSEIEAVRVKLFKKRMEDRFNAAVEEYVRSRSDDKTGTGLVKSVLNVFV